MKFWFSGEIDVEIDNSYSHIRKAIEDRLNNLCAVRDYGDAVKTIAIIPMILRPNFQQGKKERRLWKRAEGIADYRMMIDFYKFKQGNDTERQRLLLRNTIIAIRDLERKTGNGFAGSSLVDDILAQFKLHAEDVENT